MGFAWGVPIKVGAGGMEQVIEIKLMDHEQKALEASAASVQELVEVMRNAKAQQS